MKKNLFVLLVSLALVAMVLHGFVMPAPQDGAKQQVLDGTWYPQIRLCDCVEVAQHTCHCRIAIPPQGVK